MKTSLANLRLIEVLREFLMLDRHIQEQFLHSSSAFTRKRKLTFSNTVLIIINLCKKSLSLELENFGSLTSTSAASASAFCQQRTKLKWQFFQAWNTLLVKCFYILCADAVKRWQGLRLIAVDGSTTYLVNTPKTVKHFGGQLNQSAVIPMARVMNYFDVLNKISIASTIEPIRLSEQFIANRCLDKLEEDMLAIYDRGYPSFTFFYLHMLGEETEKKFVVRCNHQFMVVKDFVASGQPDLITTMHAGYYHVKQLHEMGYVVPLGKSIPIRLLRIELCTGEIEVLATNLFDQQLYRAAEFKELYARRWAVETEFYAWKNYYQIEQFSGYSEEIIHQDFYATVFVANLHQILQQQANAQLSQINKTRKYDYQVNRNVTLGLLKNQLIRLFLVTNPLKILQYLMSLFCRYLQPIRPKRSHKRKRKGKRSSGKYQTLTNYKRAA